MSVFISIVGLGFLILIHEAGHFFVARGVGMNPRKFYLGFPPALVKTTRNGIEYGVGAVPLGGYVKIPGHASPRRGRPGCPLRPRGGGAAFAPPPSRAAARAPGGERLHRSARRRQKPCGGGGGSEPVGRGRQGGRARARRHRRRSRAGCLLAREDLEARRSDLRRPGRQSPPGHHPLRCALHGRWRQGDPHGRRGRRRHTRGQHGPAGGRHDRRDRRQARRGRPDRARDLELRRPADHAHGAARRQPGEARANPAGGDETGPTAWGSCWPARGLDRSTRRGRQSG